MQDDPHSNIKTAEDAIWWSVTIMTTVGYGDKYPVTTEGRIIAMGLMVCGIGLFGAISGLAASMFLGHKVEPKAEIEVVLLEIRRMQAQLDDLKDQGNNLSRKEDTESKKRAHQ